MSHDEITTIIARLDRLDRKLDDLTIRYERHEAQAEQQERTAAELRRFLYAVATGVMVAAITGLGGLMLAVVKLMR